MKVLIVGGGGREHALAWKIKQSPRVSDIFVAPGNAGTSSIATNLGISKSEEILLWLEKNKMDLVVVGPDSYLEEGIVDEIKKRNVAVFGPAKASAEIEWSKAYAKRFMEEENIPTSKYRVFSDATLARDYIKTQKFPLVIKASGLCMGKGVVIVQNLEEASNAIIKMMEDKEYGEAGNEVIVEEYLVGQEISVHAFCDGKDFTLLPVSKDHKKIFDGDRGPNTGGMGTVAPVPNVTEEQLDEIREKIIRPTLFGLRKRNRPFSGLLFPGIMLTTGGPKVIEYNARFGDPEMESYVRILKTDLFDILKACAEGNLSKIKIEWENSFACCVVVASGGYPGEYLKGVQIDGLEAASSQKDIVIFHFGTKFERQKYLTDGGRVFGVTATGKSLSEALDKAYKAIDLIHFDGAQFRKDIGAILV